MAPMGFALALLHFFLSRTGAADPRACRGRATRRSVEATIASFDGVALNADVLLPCPSTPEQRFPVVIFANSWATSKFEYVQEGQHAIAEMPGLVLAGHNHVWNEAIRWLDYWLMGKGDRASLGFVQVQLRNGHQVREAFSEWPSNRSEELDFIMGPRGAKGLHGSLLRSNGTGARSYAPRSGEANESITFARHSGISEGVPIVSDFFRGFNWQTRSNLRAASRSHAIWFYAPLERSIRFCGTPRLGLDLSSSEGRWQVNAYLFRVDRADDAALLSYGSVTCWDCTPMERQTRQLQLQTFCEDVSGGLALALDLFSRTFEPANTNKSLEVSFHYSDGFSLAVPFLHAAEGPRSGGAAEELFV